MIEKHTVDRAIIEHGASAVYDAANRRMAGDRAALPAVGLPDVRTLADADRIGRIAFGVLSPAGRAADAAGAIIDLARLGSRK